MSFASKLLLKTKNNLRIISGWRATASHSLCWSILYHACNRRDGLGGQCLEQYQMSTILCHLQKGRYAAPDLRKGTRWLPHGLKNCQTTGKWQNWIVGMSIQPDAISIGSWWGLNNFFGLHFIVAQIQALIKNYFLYKSVSIVTVFFTVILYSYSILKSKTIAAALQYRHVIELTVIVLYNKFIWIFCMKKFGRSNFHSLSSIK